MSRIAWAQTYPTRPVRLIVGFPAGGTTDIVARLIGQWLSERLGQQFIIEIRAGANTNLAFEAVARAPADGYTLGTVGPSNAINATLYPQLNIDLNRDLAMVAGLNNSPLVLEVHPAVPVNSVPEFISYAKTNPARINMASFGAGSISHVAGELFKIAAGLERFTCRIAARHRCSSICWVGKCRRHSTTCLRQSSTSKRANFGCWR